VAEGRNKRASEEIEKADLIRTTRALKWATTIICCKGDKDQCSVRGPLQQLSL
jgi:hypothetical protein